MSAYPPESITGSNVTIVGQPEMTSDPYATVPPAVQCGVGHPDHPLWSGCHRDRWHAPHAIDGDQGTRLLWLDTYTAAASAGTAPSAERVLAEALGYDPTTPPHLPEMVEEVRWLRSQVRADAGALVEPTPQAGDDGLEVSE